MEDWYSNTYVLTHVNKIKLEYVASPTSNVDTEEKEKKWDAASPYIPGHVGLIFCYYSYLNIVPPLHGR